MQRKRFRSGLTGHGGALGHVASGSPILFEDHEALQTWAASVLPSVTLDSLERFTYRQNRAQSIRNASGIPTGEVQGNDPELTIGLTDAGALSSQTNIDWGRKSQVSADSGDGSEEDPFIVRDREFTGTADTQLDLDADEGTEYWIEFHNCRFGGTTGITVRIRNELVRARFVNCEGVSTASQSHFFRTDAADFYIEQCNFPGINAQNFIFIFVSTFTRDNALISITNCNFNDDTNDWGANCDRLIHMHNYAGADATIIWSNNEADWSGTTFQPSGFLAGGASDVTTLTAHNNVWVGGENFLDQGAFGSAPLVQWSNIDLQNNNVLDTNDHSVDLTHVDGVEIASNYWRHESDGTGAKFLWIRHDLSNSGVRPSNLLIHHNKYNKTVSDTPAGDECVAIQGCAGTLDIYNEYGVDVTEDFIEVNLLGESITYVNIYNIVADDCNESIVTIDRSLDEGTWSEWGTGEQDFSVNGYIRHIYGACNEWGVSIRGVKGVIAHDIYPDNSAGSSESVNVDDWDNTSTPAHDIFVAGPLPLDAEVGAGSGNQITISGANGDNIDYAYIDESEVLQED